MYPGHTRVHVSPVCVLRHVHVHACLRVCVLTRVCSRVTHAHSRHQSCPVCCWGHGAVPAPPGRLEPPSVPAVVTQGHPEPTDGLGRLGCGCSQLGHPRCGRVWVLGGGQAGRRVLGRD